MEQIEDDLFNPDYVEVDRIMDFARSTDDRGEVTDLLGYTGWFRQFTCVDRRHRIQAWACRASTTMCLVYVELKLNDLLILFVT